MGSSKDTGHRVLLGFMVGPRIYHFSLCNLERVSRPSQPGFPICKVEETLLSALQSHSKDSLRSKEWLLQEASLSLRVWGGNIKVRAWGLKERCRGRQNDSVEPVPGSQKSVAMRNVGPETRGSGKGGSTRPKLRCFPMRCPFFPVAGEFALL